MDRGVVASYPDSYVASTEFGIDIAIGYSGGWKAMYTLGEKISLIAQQPVYIFGQRIAAHRSKTSPMASMVVDQPLTPSARRDSSLHSFGSSRMR